MSKKNRGNRPPTLGEVAGQLVTDAAQREMIVTRVAGGDTAEGLGVGARVAVDKALTPGVGNDFLARDRTQEISDAERALSAQANESLAQGLAAVASANALPSPLDKLLSGPCRIPPNARLRLYLGAAMRLSAFVNGRQSSEFMTSELDLEPHEYVTDALGYHVTTAPLGKAGQRIEGQRITFLIPWGRVNQAVVLV